MLCPLWTLVRVRSSGGELAVRRRRSKSLKVGLLAVVVAIPISVAASQPAHGDPAFTVTTLHFAVHVGPTGAQSCDVIGDLYLPADASPGHRVPAILTTNGFGGSKDDQTGIGTGLQRGQDLATAGDVQAEPFLDHHPLDRRTGERLRGEHDTGVRPT